MKTEFKIVTYDKDNSFPTGVQLLRACYAANNFEDSGKAIYKHIPRVTIVKNGSIVDVIETHFYSNHPFPELTDIRILESLVTSNAFGDEDELIDCQTEDSEVEWYLMDVSLEFSIDTVVNQSEDSKGG